MIQFTQLFTALGILVAAACIIAFLFGVASFLVAMYLRQLDEFASFMEFRRDKEIYKRRLREMDKEAFEKSLQPN